MTEFTAESIALAIKKYAPETSASIYVSGGGSQNPLLMQRISALLPDIKVGNSSEIGIPTDAKEAVLFAVLANECVCGNGEYLQNGIKGIPVVSMGKISFPN